MLTNQNLGQGFIAFLSGGAAPVPPSALWNPAEVDPCWDDINGSFQGDLSFFLANADLPTVSNLDFSCSGWLVPLDSAHFNLPALVGLIISFNQLTSLDLIHSPLLDALFCDNNLLASLDLTSNTALTTLVAAGNPLTTITGLSGLTGLIWLDLSTTQMAPIDLSPFVNLQDLRLSGLNTWGAVSVTTNTALTSLMVDDMGLAALDISNQPSLVSLQASINPLLTTVDLSFSPLLTGVDFHNNGFAQPAVDLVLSQLVANGQINGLCSLNGAGMSAPSAAGLIDRAALMANGWTVNVNP